MRNYRFLQLAGIMLFLVLSFSGCVKDDDTPDEESPVSTSAKLSWSVNGGANVSSDDAFFVPSYNEIFGNKAGVTIIDIILASLNKGTHAISPSGGVTLDYFDGTNTQGAKSGSVIITENTGTLLSGSFNCTLSNGSTISGQFSNIPKK